jgi:hypothetical protein
MKRLNVRRARARIVAAPACGARLADEIDVERDRYEEQADEAGGGGAGQHVEALPGGHGRRKAGLHSLAPRWR